MARNGNSKGMKETKFKDTELGKIPEEWDYGKFEDYLDKFSAGATPYRGIASNFIGTIPWVSSGELNYNYITDTREHISQDAQKSTHLTLHPKGTFLIAITGLEAAGTRGRCAFIETPATTNQSCLAIYSTEKMIVEYLFWFYQQWSDYLAFNFSQGSKQQSFTAEIVKKLPIYAPSLSEQQRIASALSDADALVTELDVLIEKKRAIMAGTMQELLTGKRRLQGYNEKWKESEIEDIGNLIRGVSFDSDSVSTSFFENSIPILRANNIVDGNLFLHDLIFVDKHFVKKHQYHRENDILICSANGSKRFVGKAALIKGDDNISFGAFMTTLRCKNASMALYFSMFMRTDEYRKQINDLLCGSAINNLNSKQLYTIKLKHPSDQAEQHAIATILSDMDAEIAELEAKRDKYKEVRQGMMQQLLTGKIRLI